MSNSRKRTSVHHDISTYPAYGYVWFEEGPEKAASIYGTSNGSAVCVMEVPDAKEILEQAGMTVRERGNTLIATDPDMGEFRLPVFKYMVLFDGSWSLYHRLDKRIGRPSPLPHAWKKRVNMD